MKFVLVATEELKQAPVLMKISYAIISILAITIIIETIIPGSLYGVAPSGISTGGYILGGVLAFVIFDIGNTLVRKRKMARFLAILSGIAAIIWGTLNAIAHQIWVGLVPATLGLILIILLNLKSSTRFFSPEK